jgi:hypothetical protein
METLEYVDSSDTVEQTDTACQMLLDRARWKFKSDGETARKLGVSRHAVSHWRTKQNPMPDDRIAILSALLGEEPLKNLAEIKGGEWAKALYIMSNPTRFSLAKFTRQSLERIRFALPQKPHRFITFRRSTTSATPST